MAKLAELEAQKVAGVGGGGLGGLNLAEMEMGALRGELEGWRLVAVDAQERHERIELDLKAAVIEIKASRAPMRPLPTPPTCPPPVVAVAIPAPRGASLHVGPLPRLSRAGSASKACRRQFTPSITPNLTPNLERGHRCSGLSAAVGPLIQFLLAHLRDLRNLRGGSAQHQALNLPQQGQLRGRRPQPGFVPGGVAGVTGWGVNL